MSRIEENAKLHLPNSFREDIQVQIAQAKFLEDISRSLAVIADHYFVEKTGDVHTCCYWNDDLNWCTLDHKTCPDNCTCEDFD